jgi:hypothetical protein
MEMTHDKERQGVPDTAMSASREVVSRVTDSSPAGPDLAGLRLMSAIKRPCHSQVAPDGPETMAQERSEYAIAQVSGFSA